MNKKKKKNNRRTKDYVVDEHKTINVKVKDARIFINTTAEVTPSEQLASEVPKSNSSTDIKLKQTPQFVTC